MAVIAQPNGFYFTEGDTDYCVDHIAMFAGMYNLRLLAKQASSSSWGYIDGIEFDDTDLASGAGVDSLIAKAKERFNTYLTSKHGKVDSGIPESGIARLNHHLDNLSYDPDTKTIG
jgi:hypothetical protein